MIKAVLFDLGDTLIRYESNDPRHYFERGVRLAYDYLDGIGVSLPALPAYARRIRRRMLWTFVRTRLRRREVRPIESLQKIHAQMGIGLSTAQTELLARRYFEPMRRSAALDADAPAALAGIRDAGRRMGIISNTFTPPFAIDEQLGEQGILDYFPVRVYSCEVGVLKQHPRIFHVALEALGVSPEKTLYVGDRPSIDVKGASQIGMRTALKIGDRRRRRGRHRPDYTIRRLTELPAILENA
jgi:HAD superfamily hydrolase (TIGR01549 family)